MNVIINKSVYKEIRDINKIKTARSDLHTKEIKRIDSSVIAAGAHGPLNRHAAHSYSCVRHARNIGGASQLVYFLCICTLPLTVTSPHSQ